MQCNGLKDPSWFLMQNANGDVINPYDNEYFYHSQELPDPQIINYAADILYRGCDRYRCRGPINKILKGLKRIIFMMQWRFIDNSRRARCGFKVKGSAWWFLGAELYFGEENIRIVTKFPKAENVGEKYMHEPYVTYGILHMICSIISII